MPYFAHTKPSCGWKLVKICVSKKEKSSLILIVTFFKFLRLQKQIYLLISGSSFALFYGNYMVVDLLER